MALKQKIKEKVITYYEGENWFKLALLIIQFGREIIEFLREYINERNEEEGHIGKPQNHQ